MICLYKIVWDVEIEEHLGQGWEICGINVVPSGFTRRLKDRSYFRMRLKK